MLINDLPTELLQIIFGHCDGSDRATLSAVCHRWSEAVQPLLLRNIRLKVCYDSSAPGPTRYQVVDKTILLETDRRYTGFRIEWGYRDTNRNKQILKELLDVCQERFRVRRLYLCAPPQRRLTRFFVDRQQWLQTLVELHVTLGWSKPAGGELSLPSLKQLTWCEPRLLAVSDKPIVLIAPELCRLKIVSNIGRKVKVDPEDRPLLAVLKLKSCPKLENVTIEGFSELHQRHVDSFEPFLRQLRVLSLYDCEPAVVTRLCGKCSNLKELTIRQFQVKYNMLHLQISPVLSDTLEDLTLLGASYPGRTLIVYGRAIFSKLKRVYVHNIGIDLDLVFDQNELARSSSLVAPQLVTFIAGSSQHNELDIVHKEQIRTMKMDLDDEMETNVPPNVTELYLRYPAFLEARVVKEYVENFPNLTRLTLNKFWPAPRTVDCTFIERLPKLESFSAGQLFLQLTDCRKFASLKSLILSNCVITSEFNDESVQLTALEYVRIEKVKIIGHHARRDQFPIRVNERQPPIQVVSSSGSAEGQIMFSSMNFKSTIREELVPDFLIE